MAYVHEVIPLTEASLKYWRLDGLSRAHTSPTDPDLPKLNHLVRCGQGYDWPSLVTFGLELAPESCSHTMSAIFCRWLTTKKTPCTEKLAVRSSISRGKSRRKNPASLAWFVQWRTAAEKSQHSLRTQQAAITHSVWRLTHLFLSVVTLTFWPLNK